MVNHKELIELYHTAHITLDRPSRHARMIRAVKEYYEAHLIDMIVSNTTKNQVYRELCTALA